MAKQQKNLTQFNVRITPELISELDSVATRYGAESGNKVAAEIVEQYLPFWIAAETVRQQTLEQQRAHVMAHTSSDTTPVLRFEKPAKKPKLRPKESKKLSG